MMRTLVAAAVAGVVLAVLAGSASAASSPRTLPGWPRSVPGDVLLPGPGGGVVVVGEPAGNDDVRVATAYRLDGRRMWAYQASCGRCRPGGSQPTALQADGTYGPIGGIDAWSVDQRGRRAARCLGLVLADSTCITATSFNIPSWETPRPGFAATNTTAPWVAFDSGHEWLDEDDSPTTVRDGAGLVYAGFPAPWVPGAPPGEGTLSGVLIAADPVTHAVAWTRVGPHEALGGFSSGVLAGDPDRVVSVGSDGVERWARTIPGPRRALIDEARDRVYVSTRVNETICNEAPPSPRSPACASIVRALRASTGATVWRISGAELMSVGRGGRVYLGTHMSGRDSVRAVRFTNGSTVWQHGSRLPIAGVQELANGTVAVLARERDSWAPASRMAILDPR